ncbi:MAG: hypothetical protein ACD_37C00158G0002 [uncultured bacterium]|nr:MAG: hypothetical protein ACD_37C00158G0002 [uncultured bacterium]
MMEALETSPKVNSKWFSVEVSSAHLGAGKRDHHVNYVYAANVIDALSKVKRMRGWKRNIVGSHSSPI